MEQLGERLLVDDERVRVWEDHVRPGGTQRLHRHDRPYLSIVVEGADGEILAADGTVRYALHRVPGDVRYFGPGEVPVTHALRNTGKRDIRVVVVELLAETPGRGAPHP